MVQIKRTEGLSTEQVRAMVNQGGKFVVYTYCVSIIIMTFKRGTDIMFIKPGESKVTLGLPYFFLSLFLGWWGFPWGPIYTIQSIANILGGGKDVTAEVMAHINQNDANYGHTGYGQGLNSSAETANNSSSTYNIK